jgi:hypothetical protein
MTTQITKKEQNANYYQKNKSHVVSVRLNEKTMTKFKELEEETKLGKSELVRAILDKAEIRKPNPKVTDDVLRELSAIGNNINQLARAANIANESGMQLSGLGLRLQDLKDQLAALKEKL